MKRLSSCRCLWCDEPVTELAAEKRPVFKTGGGVEIRLIHRECAVRGVVGGINHQKGICTCCGGSEQPDPPELSRHQAAYAASDYHAQRARQRQHYETMLRFIFGER